MRYRHEHKFFLNSHTAAVLRGRASAVMRPDSHSGGIYTVNNIYLDDMYSSFYYAKLIGGFSRDKYRIRFYNGDLSFIRLERKVKDGSLSYKQSAKLTLEQYEMLRAGDFDFTLTSDNPLLEKLGTLHRLKNMRPAAEYSYIREAYVYPAGNVRVTFDSRIGENVPGLAPVMGEPLGNSGMVEVKFDSFLPSVIADLLHGLPLLRTEMSKYAYVYEHERRMKFHARKTYRGSDQLVTG